MKFRHFLIFILSWMYSGQLLAQCPATQFSAPDSACGGVTINLINSPTSGVSYQWDMCPGEMESTPVSFSSGADPNLSFNQQVKLVKQNGNYFLFVTNFFGTNSLARYDYGNSLSNTPTFYSYGVLGVLNQPIGLDIINENGTWYALVANYGSLRLSRIDLGTDISANTASAVDLGQFGFNGPRSVRIAYDGINYYSFVTNDGGSSIIRIDFGSSITNSPSGSSPISNAAFNFTWGFDIKYDCVLGKWIGFTASYNLSQMHVLDFGNSPGNAPTIASSVNTLTNPSGLQLVRDGEDWHVLVISAANLKLENFKVPGNLLATPVSISADTVGSMNSPRELTILKDSSNYHCFLSNASGTISRIQWNSPCQNQPQYSEDPNGVSIVINNEGFNHVTLSANSGNGITSYFTDSVFIKPTPLAGFTNSITCVGNTIQFNDTTLINNGNITNWQWDFGDLTPLSNLENPTHQYATAGNYTVTLEVISDGGCFGVASKQISVNPLPIASFNFTNNPCATYPVAFTDLSSVSGVDSVISWSWNFGDNSPLVNSQNPIHPFDSSGSFQISLIVTASSGCIDSTSQSINILSTPVSVFTVSETCVNETAVFNNSSYISGGLSLSYIWSFGDNTTSFQSNPTHQYPSVASNYSVSLISTASNGCEDTLTTEIRIASKPIPAFSFSPMVVCVGNTVSFTSTSSGTGNDTIAQHIWDFGDQTGSTDKNPFHAFADTGYYNITLTVVSPTYCDSSITQQIYVIPSPTATFTAANTCLGTSVQFNPLITTPPGTQIDSVVWDFGDGTLFNGITSPQHQYSAPGTYSVNLTVYNNLLCTGSYTDSVIVYPLPQAAFNYSLACSGSEINFDGNLSTVSNDTINSWLWNFGNLGISTDAAPTFTFSDSGYYDVTLIVSTIHGCSDTLTQNIFIIPSPDFNFSFVAPCLGQPTTFTYIDNTTPPAPANLLWDFGDNSTSGLLNPTHLYTNADTFNVSLLVLNPNTGCSNSVEKQLVVKPNPEPGFIVNNGCEGTVISFTDTSTILTGSIAAWSWDLDAAGQSNAQDPDAVFSDPGIFTINLTVTSALGCSANTSSQVTIYPEPQVSFVPDPIYGSPPLTVNFTNQTSGGINFNWDFGDGNNSQSENPSHIFQDTGSYAVTLQAISFYGCSSTYTQTIAVLVPYIDAAVENTYLGINNNIARVSASIINKGNITITTMDLKAVVDDGTPITETWAGELKPGNSILYTFNAGYILSSGSNPSYACVTVNTVNGDTDDNISNNSKCIAQNTEFDLYGIYPNPFQDNLSISFNLPISGDVSFVIYDSKGSKVSEVNNISYKNGFNTYTFDSRNLSQGVYFISMQYRDFVEIIKAVRY